MRGSHIQKHGLQRPLTLHHALQKPQVLMKKKNVPQTFTIQSASFDNNLAVGHLF